MCEISDYGSRHSQDGGNDHPLPPKVQALVEGRSDMAHDLGGTGGAILERLPPGDGPLSVPEHIGPVYASQNIPLTGNVLTPHRSGDGELLLPGKAETFSPAATKGPLIDIPTVSGALGGNPQSATAREDPSGMYIYGDLESYQSQDHGTSDQENRAEEHKIADPTYPGEISGGSLPLGSRGGE